MQEKEYARHEDSDSKHALLLNWGPRENEVWKELGDASKNKNEVLRRGLHAYRFLSEIDERVLLDLLSESLGQCDVNNTLQVIKKSRVIAYAAYSTMIVKKGLLAAESFETIPLTLAEFENALSRGKENKIDDSVLKSVEALRTSLITIFGQKPKHSKLSMRT